MKNCKENENYVSAERAAAAIKSGDTIWVGDTTSNYNTFLEALVKRENELEDVTILLNKSTVPCTILDELRYKNTFHVISFFKEALIQTYKKDKIAFLQSESKAAVARICRQFGVNTLVSAVCPPDQDGFFNVGKAGVFITAIINKYPGITNRIAIIDELLPFADGINSETSIPLASFNYVCSDSVQEPEINEKGEHITKKAEIVA